MGSGNTATCPACNAAMQEWPGIQETRAAGAVSVTIDDRSMGSVPALLWICMGCGLRAATWYPKRTATEGR